MEKMKRKQTIERIRFKMALNKLNEYLQEESGDHRVSLALEMLEEKANELQLTTMCVKDTLFDDPDTAHEEILQEYEDSDEYREKFLQAKHNVADYMATRVNVTVPAPIQVVQDNNLSKIESKKFDGNVDD